MDTLQAFAKGEANRDKELMVFDWDKAVSIIKERNLKNCGAGLKSDFEWTAGMILVDGKPYTEDYTYLASTWATPQLIIYSDEDSDVFDYVETVDCWKYFDGTYGSDTKFPEHLVSLFEEC